MTTTALSRPVVLSLESFARLAGLHPELVGRLVALGVLDAERRGDGRLVFRPEQLAVLARVQRLRAGLGLDYVAAAVVCQLLVRIDVLEAALRQAASDRPGRPPWTPTA